MTYTILSASYSNPDHTAAVILTEEAGAVAISEVDTPEEWAALQLWGETNAIAAFVPPPSQPYRLYKSVFIERMTPEEAATFEAHLNAHELAKLRLMYHAVEYFVSDDPLVAVLHWELMQEFGETRADELLAAE